MKKLLTVSLFAIMAVSAANADIASTDYVGKQITATAGTLSTLTTTEKGNLVGAINSLKTYVDDEISTVDEGAGAMVDTVSNELAAYKTSNDTAVAAAQAAAEAAQADADANAQAIAGLDTTYVSESEMSSFKTSNTSAIATAKSEAIEAAATDATTKANAAEAAAKAASDSKGSAAQALTDAKAYADAEDKKIEDTIGTVDTGKTVVQMITEAKNAASTGATEALDAYKESNNAAVQAAQAAAEAAQADADANAQEIAGLDATYVSESEMSSFKTSNTSAIATAKSEAIEAAATDATTKANAAEAAAKAASDPKGSAAQALTDAKTFTTEQIEALGQLATIDTACAQGVTDCALVIRSGEIKWEKVSY